MTPLDQINQFLTECRELDEKATKGPWYRRVIGQYDQTLYCIDQRFGDESILQSTCGPNKANGEFIAQSRQRLPQLERALGIAVSELQDIVRPGLPDAVEEWAKQTLTRIAAELEKP